MAHFMDLNGVGQVTAQDFRISANMMDLQGSSATIGSHLLS